MELQNAYMYTPGDVGGIRSLSGVITDKRQREERKAQIAAEAVRK